MAIAGTIKAMASGDGVRVGISADEIADIARYAAQAGGAWATDGCTALVWAITNLAGAPLNRTYNGDMTVNDNPLTPYWSTSASFAGYSVSADSAGDGWEIKSGITKTNYGTLLKAGDLLRIEAKNKIVNEGKGIHSMVVSRVEGSGPENIWVVDNWGGKISEHRLSDVVSYMNGFGGIGIFSVQRLADAFVSENAPKTLAGWGEGNFDVFSNVVAKADLVVSNASVDDLTITIGQSVTVDWAIDNKGSGAAASSYAGVYLSTDANWSSNDILLGGESTSALAAGSRDTGENATFTLAKTVSAGSYYILVVADNGKLIGEASESNNVWAQKITVSAKVAAPDLVIQDLKLNDYTIRPGQSVKASWDAKNLGDGEADSSLQFLFLSKDRSLSKDDIYLDQQSLGSMDAYELDSEYEYFNMPTGLAKGRYYIAVVADAGLDVAEANEANNISWVSLDII